MESMVDENSPIADSNPLQAANEPQESPMKVSSLPPIFENVREGRRHSDIIEIDESQSNEVEDLLLMFKDKGKSLRDAVKSFTDQSKQT